MFEKKNREKYDLLRPNTIKEVFLLILCSVPGPTNCITLGRELREGKHSDLSTVRFYHSLTTLQHTKGLFSLYSFTDRWNHFGNHLLFRRNTSISEPQTNNFFPMK